jgi:hypothetical protein
MLPQRGNQRLLRQAGRTAARRVALIRWRHRVGSERSGARFRRGLGRHVDELGLGRDGEADQWLERGRETAPERSSYHFLGRNRDQGRAALFVLFGIDPPSLSEIIEATDQVHGVIVAVEGIDLPRPFGLLILKPNACAV